MNNATASNFELNHPALVWMFDHAEIVTLEDGTVSRFFEGKLPSRMRSALQGWVKEEIAAGRLNKGRNHSGGFSGATFDWSLRYGKHISTQDNVKFTFNDYTAPIAAELAANYDHVACMLAAGWL